MNPDSELDCTRRHFFSRSRDRHRRARRLASLVPARRPSYAGPQRLAALRAHGEARHLSAPVRRALADSICSTTSRSCRSVAGPNCRTRSAWDSASPA